jgi:hypothetical protein
MGLLPPKDMITTGKSAALLTGASLWLWLAFIACSNEHRVAPADKPSRSEAMTNQLSTIANPDSSDEQISHALTELGPAQEPSGFWTTIANDGRYRTTHRRLAVIQIFTRHVKPGMSLAEIAKVLATPLWLGDEDVAMIEDLGGHLPVALTPTNTVFAIRVFPEPAAVTGLSVVFLSVAGHVSRSDFLRLLRGQPASRAVGDAMLLECGFS